MQINKNVKPYADCLKPIVYLYSIVIVKSNNTSNSNKLTDSEHDKNANLCSAELSLFS